MTPDEAWDGNERRATDARFATAMNDVRDLRVGVADLAEAVQVRGSEFQKVVRQVALLLAVLLLAIVTFSLWQAARFGDRLDHGHDQLLCLLLVEPANRTAQTLIDCQKGG